VSRIAQLWLPGIAALTHLLTAKGYGYFRDELYYLACGEHLGFGYVDHPPLIGAIAAAVRSLLGESLPAIRLLPTLAAGATVGLAGAIARELGGGRYAQILAGLATLLAPAYLGIFGILSMNAFDLLFWAAGWWLLARLLRTGDQRLWLAFGALAGVALENKISVLFLGFGIVTGLVLDRRWEIVRGRWLWIGGAIAGLLFLPHLAWQASNGWPTLEFMENARRLKMMPLSPAAFLGSQVLLAGPAALPVWIGGLVFLLLAGRGRPYRALGSACLAILVLMIGTHAKPYYLAPAYTLLFAAGGVAVETWAAHGAAVRAAVMGLVVLGGLVTAPLAKPLLPLETYVRYAARLGIAPASDERHRLGRLPQHFADMRGWPELAETVARVYRALPRPDQERACIFGQNYGQAGAIDLFGPRLGLPKAISAHNSYYLWGPRDCTGEVVIVIDDDRETLESLFERVDQGATYNCDDCMPYEDDKPIWVARGLKVPLADLWPRIKQYI
jgi:hypothetical protein